jgi:opacity protein-like surface antigen
MRTTQIVLGLLLVASMGATLGGRDAEAQRVRVEVGGGWAIPASTVIISEKASGVLRALDVNSAPHAYGAAGLVWTLSDNLALEGRVRAQQLQLRGSAGDISGVERCEGSCPDGHLRVLSVEGQLALTSVGPVNPYFLVGIGVARTTLDGTVQFREVDVTDAGGDVGFGATTQLVEGLLLTAEIRATGSLPGAKENAVTVFPFSVGLSYEL